MTAVPAVTARVAPSCIEWEIEQAPAAQSRCASELRDVWSQDPNASAFAAPSFLGVRARDLAADGATAILARGVSEEGQTIAYWPLMVDRAGILRFVQDEYADHCTCSAIAALGDDELGEGFAHVLQQVRPRGVFLKNIPPWGRTLGAVRAGLSRTGWSHRAFSATPCPVISVEPGPDAAERFRKEIERHKRVRGYQNRLARERNYVFEVFRDGEDLESWTDQFCDIHEWHWNRTCTPSRYREGRARDRLISNLRAWNADKVLVRFSIRLGDQRVASVVGLLSHERLVYHHVVTSPGWQDLRAGHVLIRLIALWASEHGFRILDFGVGGEEYKRRYATHEDRLWRVSGSRARASSSFARGCIEERIRTSPALSGVWDRWVNGLVRGEVLRALRNARTRARVVARVDLRRSVTTLLKGLVNAGVIPDRHIVYRATGRPQAVDREVIEPRTFDVLRMLDREGGLSDSRRAALMEYRYLQARPFGIVERGCLKSVAWLRSASPDLAPAWIDTEHRALWSIEQWVTTRDARGRGLCSRVLEAILGTIPADDVVLISAPGWDRRSRRAIVKAGFEACAVRTKRGAAGEVRFEKYSAPRDASVEAMEIHGR